MSVAKEEEEAGKKAGWTGWTDGDTNGWTDRWTERQSLGLIEMQGHMPLMMRCQYTSKILAKIVFFANSTVFSIRKHLNSNPSNYVSALVLLDGSGKGDDDGDADGDGCCGDDGGCSEDDAFGDKVIVTVVVVMEVVAIVALSVRWIFAALKRN